MMAANPLDGMSLATDANPTRRTIDQDGITVFERRSKQYSARLKGCDPDFFDTDDDEFLDERPTVQARPHPDELITEFNRQLENWLRDGRACRYFREQDTTALDPPDRVLAAVPAPERPWRAAPTPPMDMHRRSPERVSVLTNGNTCGNVLPRPLRLVSRAEKDLILAQSAAHRPGPARRATYQDVLDAPAHQVAEVISGTLHTHPRPAPAHALARSSLGDELVSPFAKGRGGPGGWWIIDEPELHFAEDIVVPDLAGWRRERMPELPGTAHFTLAPDWVCEVLSNSTRKVDLHEKRPVYAREGIGCLWFIEPTDRTLEAFELHDGQWLLIASAKDDEPVGIRPFDAITFNLGDLWP